MREYTIWSKFGLYRIATRDELAGMLDATPDAVDAELDIRGFCCTFCDVERVAVLPCYPEDGEPEQVLAWLDGDDAPQWQAEG